MKANRGEGLAEVVVIAAVLLIAVLAIGAVFVLPNRITTERALPRLAQIAGVQPDQIQILHETNTLPLIGNTYDVSFELLIKGKYISGRCTVSGWWSDMVCRLYNGGD